MPERWRASGTSSEAVCGDRGSCSVGLLSASSEGSRLCAICEVMRGESAETS